MEDSIPLYDDPRFPGNGIAPRASDLERPLSAWGRLCKGQTIGHKGNLYYDAGSDADQIATVDLLEVGGADLDACQLQVTLGSPAAIPRTLADLDGDFQHQTGELDTANVGDGDYPGTSAPIAWPPFVARIEWGTGGTRATAYVDFVNGTTINITASWVRVTALVAPDAFNAPGTSGLYALGAFVSPGWPRSGNAQRTIYVGEIDALGESDVFVVPPFAKRVTVIGCDESAGTPALSTAYVRFWQSPDGTNNVGNYLVSGNQPDGFNVPNGGAYFSVVSGMEATTLFSVCYDLAV